MKIRYVLWLVVFSYTTVHAEGHLESDESPVYSPADATIVESTPGEISDVVEEIHKQTLLQQQKLLQLEWQLQQIEKKREIAIKLKETLETGLVDSQGNIRALPSTSPAVGGNQGQEDNSTYYDDEVEPPTLSSVQGNRAFFKTNKGTASGEVGSRLPGGFVIKKISLNQVILEQNGIEYVSKLQWGSED